MYSLGTSSQIRVMIYAGEGKTILTTAVELKLPGRTLKLSTIEEDLNNGSGFSFPVPGKWRSIMGSSTSNTLGRSPSYWVVTTTSPSPRRLNGTLKVWHCTRAT